jgi:hypothetical protein
MKDFIKSYLLELCCSYTIISVSGAIINIFAGSQTNNANVLMMFIFCNIAVFVLSIHKLFDAFSPLAMIIIQYVLALGLCFLVIFIASFIEPVSPRGWFEFFRSFTIPYIIGAALYYYRIFKETKEQDEMIKEIQKQKEE